MAKKWIFRTRAERLPASLSADDLNISPIALKMLWNRGFSSEAEINAYLTASLKTLTPPNRWPNVPRAAQIIASGLLSGKKMAVWGDYDADGVTSTALILDVLECHGFQILHHLPDRRTEGYGLNRDHIQRLAGQGCQMLLTVDCGISNQDCVDYANALGMTVVVTDHHLPPDDLPKAAALVNPRMKGDWPCENLAGVGVSFYLMAAVNALLAPETGRRFRMDDVLDLVALGTLADVMSLEGENRILAKGGLGKMEKPGRPGLAALKLASGYDLASRISGDQAVFRLAPRLNAAGRMGNPNLALDLLRAKDFDSARALAGELDECNRLRKQEENRILGEARLQADELCAMKDYAALVLCGNDWHPGIVGIVASRIVEEYSRPAVILCKDGEILKGSGRSVPGFNLYDGLGKASASLLGFGGHSQAAGVRLEPGKLSQFREDFSSAAAEAFGQGRYEPELQLDGELPFNCATPDFVRELELMQPFGPGNPEPVFSSLPLRLKSRRPLGHGGEHALLTLVEEGSGFEMKAKAWRMAHEFGPELVDKTMRIAYTPRIDSYLGQERMDLSIKDWRKA